MSKKSEALEVLKNIQCTLMIGDGGNDLHSTKTADGEDSRMHEISDEETILNHVGSMLRYTRRKKLERLAQLSHELGMFENAEGYYRELLRAFPDQWTFIGRVWSRRLARELTLIRHWRVFLQGWTHLTERRR